MKRLFMCLVAAIFISTPVLASDPYEDGYDDARSGDIEWSENKKYLEGYEDAQHEMENEKQLRDMEEEEDD